MERRSQHLVCHSEVTTNSQDLHMLSRIYEQILVDKSAFIREPRAPSLSFRGRVSREVENRGSTRNGTAPSQDMNRQTRSFHIRNSGSRDARGFRTEYALAFELRPIADPLKPLAPAAAGREGGREGAFPPCGGIALLTLGFGLGLQPSQARPLRITPTISMSCMSYPESRGRHSDCSSSRGPIHARIFGGRFGKKGNVDPK
jgi:hypothetical protein